MCKSFGVDEIDLLTNLNILKDEIKQDEFDFIHKQCYENILNEDKIYGRPVT